MKELVEESIDMLASGMDIRAFGDLLHEAWQAKRSLSAQVSNAEVDELYERRRAAGALGGKLTGAGGGGFLLLFVPPDAAAGRPRGTRRHAFHVPVRVRVGRQPDHLLRAAGVGSTARPEQARQERTAVRFARSVLRGRRLAREPRVTA